MKKVTIDIDRVLKACEMDDYTGFCLACGDDAYGVEPDARRYECESCGAMAVYGAEEVLMMGGGA